MRGHCFVITAYDNRQSLENLLLALGNKFKIIVHIDKKNQSKFQGIDLMFPNVIFLSNYVVKWGGINHLLAILDMLDMISNFDYEYVHILSGEDYPIFSVEAIYETLKDDTKIYIDSKRDLDGRRYNFFWLYVYYNQNYKNKYVRILNLAFVGIQKIFKIKKRRIGEFTDIYTGLIWGSLPKYAVDYTLNYIRTHTKYLEDLKRCKIPEEFFFQTILENSKYKHNISNNNLRFMIWEKKKSWGPRYLQKLDLQNILDSNNLFCRKVKPNDLIKEINRTW